MKIYEKVYPWYRNAKPQLGTYGIEIETETKDEDIYPKNFIKHEIDLATHKKYMSFPSLKDWTGHYDNSLRNYGVEFVLSQPLIYEEAVAALDDFGKATKGIKFIEDAPSTSVHIHWNVFNESFLTMANFFALYALYENLLTAYCGPTRRSNLFALPIRVAERIADNISDLLKGLSNGNPAAMNYRDNDAKYGALNLSAIARLGSLELRSMRGLTKADDMKEWLGIVNHLIEYARSTGLTPTAVVNMYRDDAPELFTSTFGPYADVLRKAAGDDFDLLIDKNAWYLKQIAESVVDWSKFDKCMDKVFEDYEKQNGKLKTARVKKIPTFGDDVISPQEIWGQFAAAGHGITQTTYAAIPDPNTPATLVIEHPLPEPDFVSYEEVYDDSPEPESDDTW